MINCLYCSQEIDKGKFCNKSHAASYNNRGVCRNEKKIVYCKRCGTLTDRSQNKFCRLCIENGLDKIRIINLSESKNPITTKRILVETRGRKCNKCLNIEWNGVPIPLEIEHIDGNSENGKSDNLELLCPNCHAQTPTYKNKNMGNGRHKRRERYHNKLSY